MENQRSVNVINEVFGAFEESLEQQPVLYSREIGVVKSLGEGIARLSGLPNVQSEEIISFGKGKLGLIYNLDPDEAGVILLDEEDDIEAGDEVFRTGKLLSVPVGDALLGRVVDALGRPIDEKGPVNSDTYYPVERAAPAISSRASVREPLQTGIISIDALIPIGRGQRELILGDRQTGKTAIAVDTILNQKAEDVVCIYCAIGKQRAAVDRVINDLRKRGAMDYTIVVSASSRIAVGLQYVAPYAATSMAEYFMEQGKDVLIIYDDLTWHARAYRELALLLRRPPGREAFPGDIFYIHARLLERSARLKDELGGGSITALPIIETEAQDMSAFIPTNLISITDGQIYLSPALFQKDILPAIDVGKSVSRVGGRAQLSDYRSIAKDLKLSYSQFEEMESFARFSSRLDEHTQHLIERGKRIREALKQPQFDPVDILVQIKLLHAVSSGMLDSLPLEYIDEAKTLIRETVQQIAAREIFDGKSVKALNEKQHAKIDETVKNAIRELKDRVEKAAEEQHATS